MIDENKLIEEIKSMVRPLLTPDGTAYFDDAIQAHNETIIDVLNAIEQQPKVGEWIYFTSREADDEEKEMLGFDRVINCKFPENEEEILVLYSDGYVCIDTFMIDGEMV